MPIRSKIKISGGICMGILVSIIASLSVAANVSTGITEKVFLLYSDSNAAQAKQGILIREIAKQAVLIAVRDRLGLKTWDVVLNGSNFPQNCTEYHVNASISSNFNVNIVLWREKNGITNVAWDTTFNSGKDDQFDYVHYLQKMNSLSRTDLIQALEKEEIKGDPMKWNADDVLQDSTEKALKRMDFIQQWIALRELEVAARKMGESSQTLAGNIRGYANLSQLTAFFWNAMDKAFMARSLLYAEQLVEMDHESVWALSHRAYARALVGLHRLALEDIDAARKKHAGQTDGKEALPEWLDVIDAYCRYDHGKLSEIAEGRTRDELAQFLYALGLQHIGNDTIKIEEGRKVLEKIPNCFRVCDFLCGICGVGNGHFATMFGPVTFSKILDEELGEMAYLPAEIKSILARRSEGYTSKGKRKKAYEYGGDNTGFSDADSLAEIARSISAHGAKVSEDPSWAILGNMIKSTTFAQIQRRINFMAVMWGVPVEEFLKTVKPCLVDHPYRPFIESYGLNGSRDSKAYRELLSTIHFVDAKLSMTPMMSATWHIGGVGNPSGAAAFIEAFDYADAIAGDLESGITAFCLENNWAYDPVGSKKSLIQRARMLEQVSPYSPVTVAALIVNDWENSKEKIPEWERNSFNSPLIVNAFANKYIELKDYPKAERFLKICIGKYPDAWAYTRLADVYKNQNRMDSWLAVMKESLSTPDYGLAHASVQVQIANYFMDKGEWQKAEPFAKEAAQTWAGWAMLCAVKCYEGMEDWGNAELWIRRLSERYDGNINEWYFWCKRTGHGRADEAYALLSSKLRLSESSQDDEEKRGAAVIYLLNGEKTKAFSLFEEIFQRSFDPFSGLHAILIAHDLKDDVTYGKLMNEALEKGKTAEQNGKKLPFYIDLLTAYGAMLKDNSEVDFDKAVEACLQNTSSLQDTEMAKGNQANLLYFAGRMMDLADKPDLAKKYYTRCLATARKERWNYVLASAALRRSGDKGHP